MTDAPLWTILVPTLGQREELFTRLMGVLLPQLDEHAGRVRVLAYRNNGYPALGVIRDNLLAAAESEYVSFVDDDDLVPEYYVAEIVAALASRPAHVGFKIEYSTNGRQREVVDHSLVHRAWRRNAEGVLVRDFTHLDPIRADIARRGTFALLRAGRAEDRSWVKQVRPYLLGQAEVYVDKIMYYYLWREDTSAWQRPAFIVPKPGRPTIDHPGFSWHPLSDD